MKPSSSKLDDLELATILQAEQSAALGTNVSSDLSEQRIRAYDYYMGDMADDMPAEEGRSSAVSTDVQDVVEGLLPIILDVFVAGDDVVTFKPVSASDEIAAQQETDCINHVFYQENDGFLILHDAIKDGLMSKNCFVKWWMEEGEDRTREVYRALPEDAFAMLSQDVIASNGTLTMAEPTITGGVDPATGQPTKLYDVVLERTKKRKTPKVAAVPPEEIIISKNARTIRDANYMAHICRKPQADVIAMYPDHAEVIKAAPGALANGDNGEAFARQTVQDNQDNTQTADDVNKAMRMVTLTEHYIRLALEDDDVARRYRIVTIGTKCHVLDKEEMTSWPFATGTPIKMPHRLFGRSVADLVIDIQQIKTSLLRATLDNAYYSNNQRTEVSESHASENTLDDLMNNRVGGIVRTKMPGGLNPLPVQPIGHWVMPTIEYIDSVRENRTGASRYNQGLDADSLNHTATGITKIMDAAGMRVKLIARLFAETLLVDMFRGIQEMLSEYGDAELEFHAGGQWITTDPREWAVRKHLTVTLPLGGASKQQLLAFFGQMLEAQKAIIMQQGGTNGPLVSYQNVHATIVQMTKLAGLKSADPFVMSPPPPNPNAPPPPDPKMAEVQANIQLQQQQQQADQQLAQEVAAHNQALAQQKLQSDMQRDAIQFEHKNELERSKFQHESALAHSKQEFEVRLAAAQHDHTLTLLNHKHAQGSELADRKQDLAEKTAAQASAAE